MRVWIRTDVSPFWTYWLSFVTTRVTLHAVNANANANANAPKIFFIIALQF